MFCEMISNEIITRKNGAEKTNGNFTQLNSEEHASIAPGLL